MAALPLGTEYTVLGKTSGDLDLSAEQIWLQILVSFPDGGWNIGYLRLDVSGFDGDIDEVPLLARGGVDDPKEVVPTISAIDQESPVLSEQPTNQETNLPPNVKTFIPQSISIEGYQHIVNGNLDPDRSLTIVPSPDFDATAYVTPFLVAALCDLNGQTGACSEKELEIIDALLADKQGAISFTSPIVWFDGVGTKTQSEQVIVSKFRFADSLRIVIMPESAVGRGYGAGAFSFMWGKTDEVEGVYTLNTLYLVEPTDRVQKSMIEHPIIS
ncbi:MAG: hypothetical protein KF893_02590 [Caldilineaceae bacterium]|nr:hypothetical protein [Caldilineaceae bacterium]